MAAPAARLKVPEATFGIEAAAWIMTDVVAGWVQDLGLLVERVEAAPPPGAPDDWQAGAVLRLPFSNKTCRDGGIVCGEALTALANTAMLIAISAAWNGYRAMSAIDQTAHFLRPVTFDVVADARVMRIGRSTSFSRTTLYAAADRRPVGMVSSAFAML